MNSETITFIIKVTTFYLPRVSQPHNMFLFQGPQNDYCYFLWILSTKIGTRALSISTVYTTHVLYASIPNTVSHLSRMHRDTNVAKTTAV